MEPFLFYFPVLRALSNGKIIRFVAALALRIQAALAILGGLFLVVITLKGGFASYVPASVTIGAVISAVLILVCSLAIAQVMYFRSNSILGLQDGPYTIIPILSINLRCVGEVYATFLVTMAVGGCLLAWLTGGARGLFMSPLTPFLRDFSGISDNNFLSGLLFLVLMLFGAFGALLLFYFLAEAVVVLVDMANNIRQLVPSGMHATVIAKERCIQCGTELAPSSAFCDNCGKRVE